MGPNHGIPSKFDYMKAYSFNLIQSERTNTELEHEANVGKIDAAFYRIFAWQIMGKQKERQLSQEEPRDTIKTKKQEIYHESSVYPNERLQEARDVKKSNSSQVIVNSRTDLNGVYPKRYVTTCYIKPKVLPIWYTESVLIFIGSTKRKYDEKVYFKNKTLPYYWSENMTTEWQHLVKVSCRWRCLMYV
ncbi:hypothetical protein GWI33_014602 [Rhynchophorus ferrugineus]|uniref:Uncharacterized protein n=1 Tax=Rhynchophorus ferrugineus TaxID=354439 RepID=A0A834MC72_RHYFE|nr:hypothetical protein GWI33_014602 [Rhynchophorus ferrugineus]